MVIFVNKVSRFVVFLRGINVGDHVISKEKLLKAFASSRFRDVSTSGQSGNVVFRTDMRTPEEVRKLVETRLCQTLNFEVAVFVRTLQQLKQLVQLDPFRDQGEEDADFQVTFLASAPAKFPLKLPFSSHSLMTF